LFPLLAKVPKGKSVSLAIEANTTKSITRGAFAQYEVWVNGDDGLDRPPLFSVSVDVCDKVLKDTSTPCPVEPGTHTYYQIYFQIP
jgi:hypothetical protein